MACPHCGLDPFLLAPGIQCVSDRTPRLDALLASNEPPLETDTPMLQQKLAQARADSADLDIRITAVRAVFEGLLAQKATVDGYAEQIQAIFHPVRTLPTDVLGEIFASFVDDVMYATFDDVCNGSFVESLDIRNGPCVLTHVSSVWRRTALDLPRLWSRIQLKIDRYYHHASASFLQNILARSLNLPLHITLCDSDNNFSDYAEVSALLGTSNRWQSAAMALTSSTFVALTSRVTLNALRTVWINQRYGPIPQNQIRILERAPRLRSIVVHDVSAFLTDFTVAWSQITHFTGIETMSLNSFRTLFSKAVNLWHASFPANFHIQIDSGHDVQRSMSNITRLEVGSSQVANMLLNNIDFPRLEILHFAHLHINFPNTICHATGSLSLRELSVRVDFVNSDSLIAFLGTVPNLGTLELLAKGKTELYCVAVLGHRPALIPQLHTLRLRALRQGMQVTKDLVEIIKSRRSSCSGGEPMLRRIILERGAQSIVCPDALNGFEELVGQGLEVQWRRGGS